MTHARFSLRLGQPRLAVGTFAFLSFCVASAAASSNVRAADVPGTPKQGFATEVTLRGGPRGLADQQASVGFCMPRVFLGVGTLYAASSNNEVTSYRAFGPSLRVVLLRSESGQAEMIGTADMLWATVKGQAGASDKGLQLTVGGGVRVWMNDHFAVSALLHFDTRPGLEFVSDEFGIRDAEPQAERRLGGMLGFMAVL